MWNDQDFQELLEDLSASSPRERVIVLDSLIQEPSGDPRVIPHLQRCLSDTEVTLLWIPLTFGEVRWRAAEALAAEYAAQGILQAVVLENVPEPLSPDDIGRLARQHGIAMPKENLDANEKVIALYRALRDSSCIALHPLELAYGSSETAK